ncbi:hypothetical protein TNCV_4757381 [Trichonephila clavipes]|nr:hypothetical protein TNCV_4757381 [Trichonephila clavipes]
MVTPGSSFNPTTLDHEVNLGSWLEIYANLQSPKTPKSIIDKVQYISVTTEGEYSIETDEYGSDSDTDLPICGEEDE